MQDCLFYNSIRDKFDLNELRGQYNIYLLCKGGRVEFYQNGKIIAVTAGDLAVWPRSRMCDRISICPESDVDVLLVSDYFLDLYRPETEWDTIGMEYLEKNPVLRLGIEPSLKIAETLKCDFEQLRLHIEVFNEYLGEESTGSQLRVLLYDIWRASIWMMLLSGSNNLPSAHFADFLEELKNNCKTHREVSWYANNQGISPKYLSEISIAASGLPAGDWIDRFSARLLRKELSNPDVSFTDLANEMGFSSLPAFTRYVKRVLGCSPSEFRDSLKK